MHAKFTCHRSVNRCGLLFEEVIQVIEETERVVFKIPKNDLGCLPSEKGAIVLCVKNLPAFKKDELPVFLNDECRTKPLRYDLDKQMTAKEFKSGHYYWFFYDKCDNIIILMNAEETPHS